jgi:microcystin-dependent protein
MATLIKFNNFAKTTLALGCTDTDLTISVADASVFPSITGSEYFMLVLENSSLQREVVKCTNKAANTLTIVRAQEATTARSWNLGDRVALRLTAGAFEARIGEAETAIDTRLDALEATVTALSGRVPIGEPIPWLTDVAPSGFLVCDGSAVSRSTYAALFAAIGTRYGVGDGSGTFNIPDLRGEFLRGYDGSAGRDYDATRRLNRGDGTTGNQVGTRQLSALLDHTHPIFPSANNGSGGSSVGGGQTSSYNGATWATAGLLDQSEGGMFFPAGVTSGWHRNQVSVGETRPRNVSVLWVIRYQ